MAKLNRLNKSDYICMLLNYVEAKANKCTVKQLKQLIARHELG